MMGPEIVEPPVRIRRASQNATQQAQRPSNWDWLARGVGKFTALWMQRMMTRRMQGKRNREIHNKVALPFY